MISLFFFKEDVGRGPGKHPGSPQAFQDDSHQTSYSLVKTF